LRRRSARIPSISERRYACGKLNLPHAGDLIELLLDAGPAWNDRGLQESGAIPTTSTAGKISSTAIYETYAAASSHLLLSRQKQTPR
jgi:hypothetical protein